MLPESLTIPIQMMLLNLVQGKHPPELKPEHGIFESIPLVRGEFMERVNTNQIKVHRTGVEHINPFSITLSNGEDLQVDAIIACTGFLTKFPYLPEDAVQAQTGTSEAWQDLNLYKLIKPLNYDNLFMLGLVELPGPAATPTESQARWVTGVLSKRITLPPKEQQIDELRKFQRWQQRSVVHSGRNSTFTLYFPYVDDLLRPLGAVPTFGKLVKNVFTSGSPLKALSTLNAVYNSVPAAAQWRLFGHGAKPEWAMETTLRVTGSKAEMTKHEKELLEKMRPKSAVEMNGNGVKSSQETQVTT
jgi:dimethylaniline monooxygenase (N-oxide forming)